MTPNALMPVQYINVILFTAAYRISCYGASLNSNKFPNVTCYMTLNSLMPVQHVNKYRHLKQLHLLSYDPVELQIPKNNNNKKKNTHTKTFRNMKICLEHSQLANYTS
jgi:hypothetical protein